MFARRYRHSMNKTSRIKEEKRVVRQMIHLYCHNQRKEQNSLPFVRRAVRIRTYPPVEVSVSRKEKDMPPVYCPLLPSRHADKNERSNALRRTKNVVFSSDIRIKTFMERTKVRIFSTTNLLNPQIIFIYQQVLHIDYHS